MNSKEIVQELINYSNKLGKLNEDKTAYWHLQKLRAKMEEVKNNDLLHDVIVPKGTLCLDCEKKPAITGYDMHFCEDCWDNAVD